MEHVKVVDAPEIVIPKSVTISSSGNNIIHDVADTKKVRVFYLCLSADAGNASSVVATVKFGASGTALYIVNLSAGAIWARNIGAGLRAIEGAIGEDLIVSLSGAQTVYASFEYSELY